MTTSNLTIGSIAIGRSGVGGIVTQIESDRVTVELPDGLKKRVPISSIVRWQSPESADRLEDLRSIASTLALVAGFEEGEAIEAFTGLYLVWDREDMAAASKIIKEETPAAFDRLAQLVKTFKTSTPDK